MPKNVVIIGAGGHAKVIADIVLLSGDNLVGFLDDDERKQGLTIFKQYKVIGKISDSEKYQDSYFIIAIGDNARRAEISESLKVKYYTAIHPKAIIADTVKIGEGTVVMAGAVINPSTKIGKHCIVNTSCSIDHDNTLEDYVHISPGAHLAGTVYIEEYTWICAGATVSNNVSISSDIIVGAGATVLKNLSTAGTYVGTPARIAL